MIPTALIFFTSHSAFSKAACCSDAQSHICPVFTRWSKGQCHCARNRIKVFPNPQITTKPSSLLCSYISHNFGDTAHLTQPNDSQNFIAVLGPGIFCRFTVHSLSHRHSCKVCRLCCNRDKSQPHHGIFVGPQLRYLR